MTGRALRREGHAAAAHLYEQRSKRRLTNDAARIAAHFRAAGEISSTVEYLIADALFKYYAGDSVSALAAAAGALRASRATGGHDRTAMAFAQLLKANLDRLSGHTQQADQSLRQIANATDEELQGGFSLDPVVAEYEDVHPPDSEPTRRLSPTPSRLRSDAFLGVVRMAVQDNAWDAVASNLRLAEECVKVGDKLQLIRVQRQWAWAFLEAGRGRDAETVLSQAWDALPDDDALKARVLSDRGRAAHMTGQIRSAMDHLEDALAYARNAGDLAAEGIILNNLGRVYHDDGQWERGLATLRLSQTVASATADSSAFGYAQSNEAKLLLDQGNREEAIRLAGTFIEACDLRNYGYGASIGRLTRARAKAENGELLQARDDLAVASAYLHNSDATLGIAPAVMTAALVAHHGSRWPAAAAALAGLASPAFAASFDGYGEVGAMIVRGVIAADRNPDYAARLLEVCLAQANERGYRLLEYKALLALLALPESQFTTTTRDQWQQDAHSLEAAFGADTAARIRRLVEGLK